MEYKENFSRGAGRMLIFLLLYKAKFRLVPNVKASVTKWLTNASEREKQTKNIHAWYLLCRNYFFT
jgi:hypothetical protein